MKPGDEFTVNDKTYVAAEAELLKNLLGRKEAEFHWLCNYCMAACQIKCECIRNIIRGAGLRVESCSSAPANNRLYFYLKLENEQ